MELCANVPTSLFRMQKVGVQTTPTPVGSFILYNRLDDFGNLFCQSIYLLTVRALYHDAHERLRTGRTNQDSAVIAQLCGSRIDSRLDLGQLLQGWPSYRSAP